MNPKIQDDEQIREYINRIIDHELNKPDPNMNMINAYSAILNYREGGKYTLHPKKRKEELKKLSRAYKEAYRQRKPEKRVMPIWSKCLLKAGTVICSIILIIGLSVFTVSAFNGVSPAEVLSNFGKAIFAWNIGEPVEVNKITFTRLGESKQYNSIEECIQSENLSIYYPAWLPEGVYVESIFVVNSNDGDEVNIKFNTDSVLFNICRKAQENDINEENYNKIEVNGITVLYFEFENKYYASIELDKYLYSITTSDIDVLKNIVSGLSNE